MALILEEGRLAGEERGGGPQVITKASAAVSVFYISVPDAFMLCRVPGGRAYAQHHTPGSWCYHGLGR